MPNQPKWRERLYKLALTEPDPNQALFNLPQLISFISQTLLQHNEELVRKIEEARNRENFRKSDVCQKTFDLCLYLINQQNK